MEAILARDLMSDEEWPFFERFILAALAANGRKPTDHRLVLDGVFWIARAGAPWRDLTLPPDPGLRVQVLPERGPPQMSRQPCRHFAAEKGGPGFSTSLPPG